MAMKSKHVEDHLKPAPRHAARWWLVLAVSIAAVVWCGVELERQYQLLRKQEQTLAMLQRASYRKPLPKPSRADVERERQWNIVRQELSFSWYPLFSALERTSNPNIALLEFVPDKATGRLTLRGTARDMESLTAYLDGLSNEPGFHEVYLAHQKTVTQGAVAVTLFEIRLVSGI